MTVCTACVGEPVKLAEPEAAAKSAHLYEVPLKAAGSGLRTEVQAGEFQIVLDAGRALGGQQSGPSPVQAFVSSILACTQVGVRWPIVATASPWARACLLWVAETLAVGRRVRTYGKLLAHMQALSAQLGCSLLPSHPQTGPS